MSSRRSAATRQARLRAKRQEDREEQLDELSDVALGISTRLLSPGGGAQRLQVRFDVDRQPFNALMGLHRLRSKTLQVLEGELVDQCRRSGIAWSEIGWALGITGEAARLRWREHVQL